MRLTELTLSGFKSFAKTTTFAFPDAVSAIVGPNGSGKSNIAEAILWVLGEQSMKSLRGKRGEDLIFHGTPNAARLGKASVRLIFDNRDRGIALDFDAVTIERKIFRDGTNEYYTNGSRVRLRDIVELLATMGLGETKHNIIGQGEVDRVLLTAPRERREMLEEAIGLRLFQLRKREAERKLDQTRENVTQVLTLVREVAPHLRFLKTQSERAEKHDRVRGDLAQAVRRYAAVEQRAIGTEADGIEREATPMQERLAAIERRIAAATAAVTARDAGGTDGRSVAAREADLTAREARRRELEHELGRIEGRLETLGTSARRGRVLIPVARVVAMLDPVIAALRSATAEEDPGALRGAVGQALAAAERALRDLRAAEPRGTEGEGTLRRARERIADELEALVASLDAARGERAAAIERLQTSHETLQKEWQLLREEEGEAASLRAALQRLAFQGERLAVRRKDLERTMAEQGLAPRDLKEAEDGGTPEELRRTVEKLTIRLEEIGAIDPAVLREYQETKTRADFLDRELNDLKTAERDLRKLVAELDAEIEAEFKRGFAKIKAAFNRYIGIIFGGGRGTIEYVPLRTPAAGDDGQTAAPEEPEYGVEIGVDIPRKRIRGLDMLSGGERALASIALLFAITEVHPPPFLVLDETDAALDEANSRKYGEILRELSLKTQLILITHNRETMDQAGILYGVTMGEDGVSKILSLKLEEATSYGNR